MLSLSRDGTRIFCVYATSGAPATGALRQAESGAVLETLEIPPEQAIFLGEKSGARDGYLDASIKETLIELEKIVESSEPFDEGYTPAWEGGHQDHDLCFHNVALELSARIQIRPA